MSYSPNLRRELVKRRATAPRARRLAVRQNKARKKALLAQAAAEVEHGRLVAALKEPVVGTGSQHGQAG